MIINSNQMKHTCHSKGCPKPHINTQLTTSLLRQRRRVFSHTNGNKGAECHPVIDCPKNLAPVAAIRSFERARIVGLREAGWTYRRIAARVGHNISVMCRYFHRCRHRWSSGYHTRLWIRGSRVRSRPGSMDFFRA